MNNRAKSIVGKAWQITSQERHLLKFGFWPSFFGIIVGGAYIFYQIEAFKNSPLFSDRHSIDFGSIFDILGNFASEHTASFGAIITFAIITLMAYFFLPIVCQGALIHLISQIHHSEKPQRGIATSLFRFLPLFEISLIKGSVKPISFLTEWSFVIRNLGPGQATLITPFLVFFALIGIGFLFIFAFTGQFIILEKCNFSKSIVRSLKMVVRNPKTTFHIFLIIILIEMRVILNLAVILVLPITLVWISGFFATTLGIFVAGIVGFALVSLTAYITGTLSVFSNAIWTLAYWDLKDEK